MPNYRRFFVPGGTYFFTVVTHQRRPLFHIDVNRVLLGDVIRECQKEWPFEMKAIVLLPDHLHAIWTLPVGDQNYSGRWSVIKKNFTTQFLANGGSDGSVSFGKQREHRRGVWQRRFWEHTIQNEDDFQTHFDYIHFNPVRHQLVSCPKQWEPSSFRRWVKAGVYPVDWACGTAPKPTFPSTQENYGEAY
ncbi:REP-associated tyrosine transposase [Planctopirus hydrillae]|uniref:Transposase n=1 Tax=Planctopirus hydrillae TaxID=1841610 RepID=A0A1C3ET70_9PLAN|nr:transposase [Planctopirus hydrillae]ODA36481.1 transposase [Planctopirus hydrillae]